MSDDGMKKTKAYSYILPMVSDEVMGIKSNLVNVFIGDENYPELDNHIFLLYKFSGHSSFLLFEEDIKESPLFEREYDPDNIYTIKVLRVPKQYEEDFKLFKQSKYSEMSNAYKKRIIAFHNVATSHLLYGILYKKDFAFKYLEKHLNSGLPVSSHVEIDRSQEASGLLDMNLEIYRNSLLVEDPFKEESKLFETKEV